MRIGIIIFACIVIALAHALWGEYKDDNETKPPKWL